MRRSKFLEVFWILATPAMAMAAEPITHGIPAAWLAAWNDPPAANRPLQIVHGDVATETDTEGMDQVLGNRGRTVRRTTGDYRQRGLGGVVCNVAFKDYLRSEPHWDKFITGVKLAHAAGLTVWIYDEDGYPSGAAGGHVLAGHPEFEATELTYDPEHEDPFRCRPAYEHTHASNNYYAARRYANLLDGRATDRFLEITHAAYAERLGPDLWQAVDATFTDEPSLIAVHLGQLPDDVRERVRVVDPIDPAVPPLPCVPWCDDLAERYRDRFGEDLIPQRKSLFGGQTPRDRQVRSHFWSLVADLVTERYFTKIASWCEAHGVASSGHTLWEESLIHHVPLEGNALQVLGTMHIPGLDMLSSNPESVLHTGWLTAALPMSAAHLNGRRRIMTEVSDFIQKMGGQGPVGLTEMQATAAWQAAWGVTDFTLYYGIQDRPAPAMRAYTDFVGRLNAILKNARPDPQVLLYYPIHDLWSEYLPVRGQLTLDSQSDRAQRIVHAFMGQGRWLQRHQVPFCLIDFRLLATLQVGEDGSLQAGNDRFTTLLYPADTVFPAADRAIIDSFQRSGGHVHTCTADHLVDVDRPYPIEPKSEQIVLGSFRRAGRQILLVVNVGKTPYSGRIQVPRAGLWLEMHPENGVIKERTAATDQFLPLSLESFQSILCIECQTTE